VPAKLAPSVSHSCEGGGGCRKVGGVAEIGHPPSHIRARDHWWVLEGGWCQKKRSLRLAFERGRDACRETVVVAKTVPPVSRLSEGGVAWRQEVVVAKMAPPSHVRVRGGCSHVVTAKRDNILYKKNRTSGRTWHAHYAVSSSSSSSFGGIGGCGGTRRKGNVWEFNNYVAHLIR